jgi:RNA recognition motif-containing protein
MKMFVGNLSFDTSEQQLKELFSEHGEVTEVHMPDDRETGRPRGFAFVTMDSKSAMVNAIKALDGTELDGRDLKVNEAKPREDRGGGGGHRGGGGGGHRGGGGGRGRY